MKLSKIYVTALAVIAMTAALSAADVKENYEKGCAKCHGADGKGQTAMGKKTGAKDWSDAKVQAELTNEKITKAIKEGVKDGDKTKMKAFEDLSDAEVKALVDYIRAFKK
jgi:mono/diheme cytochrome c family protein